MRQYAFTEFQTAKCMWVLGGVWGLFVLFVCLFFSSLHALVLYHLLLSRNYTTFLLSSTQQISNQQKQEFPALLLKLLACVFVGLVTFLYCILVMKQNQFSPLSLGKD